MKKVNLALAVAAIIFSGTASAAAITFTNWQSGAVTDGDKVFTLISATNAGGWNTTATADFTDTSFTHNVNIANLPGITANNEFVYRIDITGTNVFKLFRVSENDVFGNTSAGSTTVLYSDAGLTSQLFTSTLLGSGAGSTYNFGANMQSVWVKTTTTGVNATNQLSNITYDVTQITNPPGVVVPEIDGLAGTGALTLMAGALALASQGRRRRG